MATFICHFTHFQYRQHEEANKYNTHKPHSHTQSPLHHCEFAIQLTYTLYSTPSWRNRRLRPQLQCSTWFWQDNHLPSLWNPPAKWTYSIPRYDCSSQTGTGLHFPNETCQEYIVIINNLDFVQLAKLFEVGEPVPFRCLSVSWSLMYKVSSTRFAVSLGRSLVFLSFRYKERWFPSQDGYIMIFLQNRKHRTILEFLESRN